jgi:hypothetical protein
MPSFRSPPHTPQLRTDTAILRLHSRGWQNRPSKAAMQITNECTQHGADDTPAT